MPIDDLVGMLRDAEVGLWCKRAAWLVVLIDAVLAVFQLLGLAVHGGADPITLLTTLLGYLANAVWQFFVLYALGALVGVVVRS